MKTYLKQYFVMWLILLMAIIGGIYAFNKLSIDLFPNLNYPLVKVITHKSGMSSKDIELLVTNPIESSLNSLQRVRRISSVSRAGLSTITVQFEMGISPVNARNRVIQAIAKISNSLPNNTKPLVENLGTKLTNVVTYGVTYPKNKTGEVTNFCTVKLSNILKSLNGVNKIEVIGGRKMGFIIKPKESLLIKNNLSYNDIKKAVQANNLQILDGYMERFHLDYAISGDGKINSIKQLRNIPIKQNLLLKDVATVKKGFIPQRYTVHINGKGGIALLVYKNTHANTITVVKELDKRLKNIQSIFPQGMKITKMYDQSKVIRDSSNSLRDDIIVGIVLVFIMMILFLGNSGSAFFVSMSVPVIAVITLIFMHFLGLSLNMITLGAMAVAVGMVVDDSIIVIENIMKHVESGKDKIQATIDGTKEIVLADVSATLTNVVAFIPFLFLGSLAGNFTRPFGIVVSVMLILSLIISLSIIPAYMAHRKNIKLKKPIAYRFIKMVQKIVIIILDKFLNYKKTVAIFAFLAFLASGALLIFLPVSFLPQVDEGAILLEYHMPPGTSLSESNVIGDSLEQIALRNKNVNGVYRRTGSDGNSFGVEPVNQGELVISLKTKRTDSIFKVMNQLKKYTNKIPGIICLYHQVTAEKLDESMSGIPAMFALTIYGDSNKELIVLSNKIEKIAKTIPNIASIVNNTKYKVPQIILKPKLSALKNYGINSKRLLESIRFQILGKQIGSVIKNQIITPIYIQSKKLDKVNEQYLKSIIIKTKTGYVPLSKLSSIHIVDGSSKIEHIDMQKVVTMPMEIDGNIKTITQELFAKIDKLHLPKGYYVNFAGEYKELLQLASTFLLLAFISGLLIYIVITVQLGNALQPLAILLNIPLLFSGAFVAMFITHSEINLSFFIGLITLMGVGIKNGIVLVDFINQKRRNGSEKFEAINEAVKQRTRPILLTVLTAIVALFPIALGIGIGSKTEQSLAISVIGGLVVNIFFTLTILPVLYTIFDRTDKKI